MKEKLGKSSIVIIAISLMAVAFGLMTVKSASFALFGGEAGVQFAGKYVPFVLYFNFIAGFFYILSGLGIFFQKKLGSDDCKNSSTINSVSLFGFCCNSSRGG